MWVTLKNGNIEATHRGNKGVTINNIQHSKSIFTKSWTDDERKAIGIYKVEKVGSAGNKAFYKNSEKMAYDSDQDKVISTTTTVIRTDVTEKKKEMRQQTKSITASHLSQSDWYVTRNIETGRNIPYFISEYRKDVRLASNVIENAIKDAVTMEDLEGLTIGSPSVIHNWPNFEEDYPPNLAPPPPPPPAPEPEPEPEPEPTP
jgi:hypothetical protein